GRYFAGPVVAKLGQTGVLLGGAVMTFIGIYLFSIVTGPMAYLAAILFAIGVCYFWPTMLGAAAKRAPLTGALGLSLIGGMGMFSSAIFQPVIGGWIDNARASASAQGLDGSALELAAGQATLTNMLIFPGLLIILFTFFFLWQKRSSIKTVDDLAQEQGSIA